MKARKYKVVQYVRLYALVIWGVLSFIYLSGDPVDESMPLLEFCFYKLIGLSSLLGCVMVGKRLNKAGKLPDISDEKDYRI